VKVAHNRRHVGRLGGHGRDVDAFAQERGVQRIKTSPTFQSCEVRATLQV